MNVQNTRQWPFEVASVLMNMGVIVLLLSDDRYHDTRPRQASPLVHFYVHIGSKNQKNQKKTKTSEQILNCTGQIVVLSDLVIQKIFLYEYRISLITSRSFLHETSHPKNGVRFTIEMRLTFGSFVKLTVRRAYACAVYTKSHMRVSPDLVKSDFWSTVADGQIWGYDL